MCLTCASVPKAAALVVRGCSATPLRKTGRIALEHPVERALALEVLRFGQAIDDALVDYRPNLLASYVFGLASKLSTFYDACHVKNAEEPTRTSRLLLIDVIGPRNPIDLIADEAGTIGYEILTSLGARYHRVYRGRGR